MLVANGGDQHIGAPIPNPEQMLAINELNDNARRDILTYCDRLLHGYHQTGDAIWLQRRRLTLQQSAAHFEAMSARLAECNNAIQAALAQQEPQAANAAPEVHLNPGMAVAQNVANPHEDPVAHGEPVNRGVPVKAEVPANQVAHVDEAPLALPETPVNQGVPINSRMNAIPHGKSPGRERNPRVVGEQGERGAQEPRSYLKDKISHFWGQDGTIRFTLRYAGPVVTSRPEIYLGRRSDAPYAMGGWMVDNFGPWGGAANPKTYVLRPTRANLALVREAYGYLRAHKCDLVLQLAIAEKLPLHRRQRDP
ncbi:hypothetical protein F5Y05DRAFT_421731 [Hypoxylon sp. FL0543]|nr:hypothetical protein F5Y05DRAFT_421731 [Hypoxylon sp. FL0543]